jgi:hypothetical protein
MSQKPIFEIARLNFNKTTKFVKFANDFEKKLS